DHLRAPPDREQQHRQPRPPGARRALPARRRSAPPPERVDGLEAAGRDEPGTGIRRYALARPLLDRGPARVVQRLLGEIEVAEEADEGGEDAPGVGTIDRLDLLARQRGWILAHDGYLSSLTGRTSMPPRRAGGIIEASWIASFRSRASMRMKPPSCSFVSTKGPSVVETLPSRMRRLVAVRTGCRALAAMKWPPRRSSSSYASASAFSASCWLLVLAS